MAKILCVLYDDPVDGYPTSYARGVLPQLDRYPDGQTLPTPSDIDFTPGELLGSVSGGLGLRKYLEGLGRAPNSGLRCVLAGSRRPVEAAEEGQRVLVIAGGDAAPLFEPVEAAFNGVALLVDFAVEGRWSTTGGALGLATSDLIVAFGDRVLDPALAQCGAGGGMRVRLIGQQPHITDSVGGGLGTEIAVDQRQQRRIVASLPRRERHRDRASRGIGEGMDLGG